ncbi:MAG TPA: molybdenum cofactor biosynthesis protein MoaE [Puia sp.]|nr:molybdenum cofactor biosynthesis protein MoaE [Puia sp.]
MTLSLSSLPAAEADPPESASPSGAGTSAEPKDQSDQSAAFPYISAESLDLVELLRNAHHPGAGAVVLFSGEVRDNNRGRDVACLEYESYGPLASKMIRDILQEAKEKWNLQIVLAQHRIGKVAIGDTAVVVITASAHRSEAYAANRHIIDRIKHEAPIWKCEYYTDGTHEWGNNCNCHSITGDNAKHIYETAPGPSATSSGYPGPSAPPNQSY